MSISGTIAPVMATRSPTPRSPLRRLLKVLGAIVVVFILAAGIGMFYSWRLANQAPEWWHPVNPSDPAVDRAARSVENTITDQLHRARPAPTNGAAPSTWTITIKDDEANAWLAARLKEWMLNRHDSLSWPAGASEPQVSFQDGIAMLGLEFTDPRSSKQRVVAAGLAPQIDEQGLWLRLESFSIGRLMLPGSAATEAGSMLEDRLPASVKENPDAKAFIEALSGKRPLVREAIMKLSDGRRVQLMRITPRAGELEIECRTLPR